MGKITFDERTLNKVKHGQGVYGVLNKPTPTSEVNETKLKELVTQLVENAFREYVRKHKGMTKADEDKFWKQFRPILLRHL